ncbi:MAG: hypothetical protein ABSE73_00065 [Planctomycetota bacterium]
MSFLDEVQADRQELAHVLKKNRGIPKFVEDLYPERAHFIYRLLENAEDTQHAGGGRPTLSFTLVNQDTLQIPGTEGALIISNDGLGFRAEHVMPCVQFATQLKRNRKATLE